MQLQEIKLNDRPEITNPIFGISEFCRAFIRRAERGEELTEGGQKYSASALRGYRSFLNYFGEFEGLHATSFTFSEASPGMAKNFAAFVTAEGLAKNSVGLVLSKFKSILSMAFMAGHCHWNGSGIKCPKETTTQVYLSIEEIRKMHAADLSDNERLILDAFTVQCFTGLRYDTLQKFLKNPLAYIHEKDGKTYLDIVSDKTGEQSVIPLGSTVLGILERHGGRLHTFTEQYANRKLKNIAEKAEITHQIVSRRTQGGSMEEVLIPKAKKVCTHTARRTLISLMRSGGFQNSDITTITGHTTEMQMLKYDRSGSFGKVERMLGNDFFNTKI